MFTFSGYVSKPVHRSALRKKLGKEYFILKHHLKWIFGKEKYAFQKSKNTLSFEVFSHKSTLLRPLRNVDMQLQHNKVVNLNLASEKINDILIEPGQSFSIWKLVGRPSQSKGYLEGLVLENGQIKSGIGGGLCQLGNLLYWIFLHSDLKIVERWRHGFDVFPDINRTIPFGCGATLSYNYVDLLVKNETENTYQLKVFTDKEYLQGQLLCNNETEFNYRVFESEHIIRQQAWGGYTRHNRILRDKTNKINGNTETEFVTENHAIMMYEPLLGKGNFEC